MRRKVATGWRTTRRLSGKGGAGCRFPVAVGIIGLLSRSVLLNCRARIQTRRSGYWLIFPVVVDGPYAESRDPGGQVAYGAQAQESPHGRRRRGQARRAYGRPEHPPVGQGLEPLDQPDRHARPGSRLYWPRSGLPSSVRLPVATNNGVRTRPLGPARRLSMRSSLSLLLLRLLHVLSSHPTISSSPASCGDRAGASPAPRPGSRIPTSGTTAYRRARG